MNCFITGLWDCHLFNTKPLPDPVLISVQLDSYWHISMKRQQKSYMKMSLKMSLGKIVTILLSHQSNKVLDVKVTWDNWYWRVVIVYQYLETSVHVCCNVMTYGRSLWTTIYVSSLNCFIAPTSPQNKTKQKQTKQKKPNKFKIYHYLSLLLIMDIMHSCHRYVEVYVKCRLNWIHCGSQSLYISVDFLLNDPRNGSYIYHCPYNWGLNN